MKTMSVSAARAELLPMIRKISKSHEKYLLVYKNKLAAVLLDIEEYRGLLETLRLLEGPTFMEGMREAEKDIKEGRTYPVEEVFKKLLKEE